MASCAGCCAGVPGCRLHDAGRTLCGIVAFSLAGVPAADVRARLHERGMNVWVSKSSSTLLDFQARPCASILQALTRCLEMISPWASGLCRYAGLRSCMPCAVAWLYPNMPAHAIMSQCTRPTAHLGT